MKVVWQRIKTAVLDVGGDGHNNLSGAQLGSIDERFIKTRIRCTREFHQGLFWKAVDLQMEQLGLERHFKKDLEQEISEKVPRPGDEWALWGVTCIPLFDPP